MDAITLSQNGDSTYRFHRNLKKNDYVPVPLRWQAVLAYHLAGKKVDEITQLTGYSKPAVYSILANKAVQGLRQKMLASTQQEFEALFARVVETIRGALNSNDDQIKLAAANQWLKANGKYAPTRIDQSTHITAEDVVLNLLSNTQVNSERLAVE
jgi:cobalamin biosynthesis Mg chelatase CobN